MGRIQNEDIKSSIELVSDGGTESQLPNDDKIYVTASSINKTLKQAIIDGDISGSVTFINESIVLDATDITNGYIDLTGESQAGGLWVYGTEREYLAPSIDYTTSLVSLVTRVTWTGDYATGGVKELVEGDRVLVKFVQAI